MRARRVEGSLAYVAGQGLRVNDLKDPTQPREIGAASITANAIAVLGRYAVVANGAGGGGLTPIFQPCADRGHIWEKRTTVSDRQMAPRT